ncbi:hypothetical protein PINS_up008261 [Pythium insidiosum]|nr:hypothetical protein PINS_up008261 [Pythium insidiosum]
MQVLRRKTDASSTPRVTLNPSMSLSFALPASMLQKLQQKSSSAAPQELSAPPSQQQPTVSRNDSDNEEEDEEDESWESRDFDSAAPLRRDDATSASSSAVNAALRVLGDDDWLDDARRQRLATTFPCSW